MNRRTFLRAGAGLTGAAALAGCTGPFETRSARASREPPVVEDRPDAVYYPTHTDEMEMAGTAESGDYAFALSYSFPHRFWTVTDRRTERVSVRDDDTIHLMLSVWDAETRVVLPTATQSIEITKDGDRVDSRDLWPMLSQSMGYHFGDNVSLPGDGTYAAAVRLAPMAARRTGAFADRFEEPATVEIEFDYSRDARDELGATEFSEKQGQEGAFPPMEMDMPLATLPHEVNLPGEVLGGPTSGDGVFLATAIEDEPRFDADGGTYLAVSPRTPYNLFPLPFMSVSAALVREGETVFDGPLRSTIDPELEYHYGTVVDGVEPGDTLELSVEAPPQVARHEGYETAFVEMPKVELTA